MIEDALARWAIQQYGGSTRVEAITTMPGNAGISYGFDVVSDTRARYVIRLAPPGVTRRGSTDVLRQVPLLKALERAGLPVASVVWSSADETLFGTDAVIQEFVPGRPLHMTEPDLSVAIGPTGTRPLIASAVATLARVHALDVAASLSDWERQRTVQDEIAAWRRLVAKLPDTDWRVGAQRLADALERSAPGDIRYGLLHGDFQTNNILYADDGRLLAVVDWELAGLGAQLLDLGWLCLFLDPSCWDERRAATLRVVAASDWICDIYASASHDVAPIEHLPWFQALAAYRFGVIAGYNVKLHRSGRRTDAVWDSVAPSIPVLFDRGLDLCRPRR